MKCRLYVLMYIVVFAGCSMDASVQYKKLVDEELKKNTVHNELFLGLRLGMTREEFYNHCWKMNKKGLFANAMNNTAVIARLDSLKSPAQISFYPEFYENRIYKLPALVHYSAFAPWNRSLFADSLTLDLLSLYKKMYGPDNILKLLNAEKKIVFVKVDGTRQLMIQQRDERFVRVEYTDVSIEKKIRH